MSSIKKNYIYNIIYQILILIIPLITAPYLSRILGATGIGMYSYTYSIVYYFMILTLLGINNYGNRTIAKVRDNKIRLSEAFWSIYYFQMAMGLLMLVLFYIIIVFWDPTYKNLFLIQSLFILSSLLDINWFFFGLEEFKKTIFRNIIVKIGTIVLIFLLVKKETDVVKYTLIMSGMTCVSQLILWRYLAQKVYFVKIKIKEIKKHIKSIVILFIPIIAVSLYKIMDKIMLGSLVSVYEVGLYENAEKIIGIPIALITSLGTVMLPRMSNIISKGDEKKVKDYISKSIIFITFLSIAMCFGLIGVSYHFAPFFFGIDFKKTGILIMLLSTTLPFISFANVIRTQYLIPLEKDKIFIISVILGAIVNFISNIIMIPKIASVGACIGTILAEITVMLYQSYKVHKELELTNYLIPSLSFIIKGLIMFLIVNIFNYIDIKEYIRLFIQFASGIITYLLLNYKYVYSLLSINNKKRRV